MLMVMMMMMMMMMLLMMMTMHDNDDDDDANLVFSSQWSGTCAALTVLFSHCCLKWVKLEQVHDSKFANPKKVHNSKCSMWNWNKCTISNLPNNKIINNIIKKISTGICCCKQFHEPVHLCAQGLVNYLFIYFYCHFCQCWNFIMKHGDAIVMSVSVGKYVTSLWFNWTTIYNYLVSKWLLFWLWC